MQLLSFEVCTDLQIKILIDDLDLLFSSKIPSEMELNTLMSLLRTARDYNTNHLKEFNTRIIVFLREDIADILKDNYPDSNKILSSYDIRINWYSQQMYKAYDDHNIPLRMFIDDRIALRSKGLLPDSDKNAWEKFFSRDFMDSFKYILNHTLYRPRDLILLMNTFGEDHYVLPVDFQTANAVLRKYVKKFASEVRNELTLHFSKEHLECIYDDFIPSICRSKDNCIEYMTFLDNICTRLSLGKKESEQIIDELLKYGILGLKKLDNGDLYFAYREEDLPIISRRQDYYVTTSKPYSLIYR